MERGRFGKVFIFGLFLALTATGGYFLYQQRPAGLPAGFASGNGRLEATEVDVATKIAGRLAELVPHEGDMVEAGVVVARLDADDLRAQLRTAEAQVAQAQVLPGHLTCFHSEPPNNIKGRDRPYCSAWGGMGQARGARGGQVQHVYITNGIKASMYNKSVHDR